MPPAKKVAIVTLGCARNEVDSEELAGRLSVGGWDLVENAESADAVLVNTCGFIEAAKRESIDTVLSLAGDDAPAVIATGCLAERYGTELAANLPEARAVLGFDDYPEIAARLDAVMRGEDVPAPIPTDRRTLVPLSPGARSDARLDASAGAAADGSTGEPHGYRPPVPRIRLGAGPVASVKLASGCDRRCAFC
ncbi:MAG: 30S ribosomal protein S12 methylthiotransferase RimO, partial [Actinomycetota bacterium]